MSFTLHCISKDTLSGIIMKQNKWSFQLEFIYLQVTEGLFHKAHIADV